MFLKCSKTGFRHLFITGFMRCGTTYLATILDEHPEICFSKPIVPEAKFFLLASEYTRDYRYYIESCFPQRGNLTISPAMPENVSILGEKTVHYIEREDAVSRMSKWFPEARLLVMLRDPVKRALSNYFFSRHNRLEPRGPEDVFLKRDPPPPVPQGFYVSPYNYLKRGIYIEGLRMLDRYFPPKQKQIIISERFLSNPESVSSLFKELGVDPDFRPPSLKHKIFSFSPEYGGTASAFDAEKMEAIVKVLKDYYRGPNKELSAYLNTSLSEWD